MTIDVKAASQWTAFGTKALDLVMGMVSSGVELATAEREQQQAAQQASGMVDMQRQLLNEQLVQQQAGSEQAQWIEEKLRILEQRGSPIDEVTLRAALPPWRMPQWAWVAGGVTVTATVVGLVIWRVMK